jgi:hypothetical protein
MRSKGQNDRVIALSNQMNGLEMKAENAAAESKQAFGAINVG